MWRVEQSEDLNGALAQVGLFVLPRLEAANVDIVQIERRLAFGHPVCEGHACATGRLNADRVETGSDEQRIERWGFAEDVGVVGGEALGTVEEQPQAGLVQDRDAIERRAEPLPQVIGVRVHRDERLVDWRRAALGPRTSDRFEQADQHRATGLGLEIRPAVGVAKDRRAGVDTFDRFGDHIVVFGRHERHVDAGLLGEVASP